jgi:hypothetical protein
MEGGLNIAPIRYAKKGFITAAFAEVIILPVGDGGHLETKKHH